MKILQVQIELKNGKKDFIVMGTIERTPQSRKGYEFVVYKGKKYQVFGGVHNGFFIDVSNPIR